MNDRTWGPSQQGGTFYPDDPADCAKASDGDTIHAVLLVAYHDEPYHRFRYLALTKCQRCWIRAGIVEARLDLNGRAPNF